MSDGSYTGKQYRVAMAAAAKSGRSISAELELARQASENAAPASKGAAVSPVRTKARPWSTAKPTTCAAGHRHASRLEARVCAQLTAELVPPHQTLLQQVRLPLLAVAPDRRGRPLYATVDFVVLEAGRIVRLVDAKGRVSRDWRRGVAALEATYHMQVEEITAKTIGRSS